VNQAGGLTPTDIELRVLGELDGVRDGTVIDLGGRRQRAVLAALIIARGDVVSAERLAECVWGDGAAARSGGPLHSYVSHLRRRMQPEAGARVRNDVIVRVGPGYQLSVGPRAVDAWQFEAELEGATDLPPTERVRRLRAALSLWRGPAYTEYADEPWAATEVARLTELRAVARDRLMDARLALGESALLVPELEALVGDDPLREERWRLLVLALYRAGRQGDALAALRRARQTLADELGIEPGPALRSLERDVLAQSPGLDGPARMWPAAVPSDGEAA
jgi:DNA-binding SARP family transcriptional activator